MRKDIILSLRLLRRNPLFTTIAVVSLALGIGANTAIFSLVNQVILRLLPVRDPERLVLFHTDYTPNGSSTSDNFETVFSNPMYRGLRDRDPAFRDVIARAGFPVTVSWQGAAEPARAEMVSGNFFTALGVSAAVGRVFAPEDDGPPGAHPVAILSHSYWVDRFGSSRGVLNQTIVLNGHPMVVIGILAENFRGLMSGSAPSVFVPLAMKRAVTPTWDGLQDPQVRWLNLFARRKPEYSLRQAQAATDVVYRALLEDELARLGRMRNDRARDEFLNHRVQLRPAAQGINSLRRRWQDPLIALMAMVGLVLLIACANIAGLLVARASARRREIAIRLALGAGRAALVRQLLVEGIVLALGGGALGLLGAAWGIDALIGLLPRDATGNWLSAAVDFRLLGFNFAVATAAGVVFALVPALQSTRPDVAATLKDQPGSAAARGFHARFRRGLVTGQVALSVILVVAAGWFSRSLVNLMQVDLGFRTERLLLFSVDDSPGRPAVPASAAFYRDLQTRLGALGGVAGVGAADAGPFSGATRGGNLTVEGYQPKDQDYVGASRVAVSPDFFHALGIPLRAGREFSDRDGNTAPKVVVINEAFARRYLAGRDPIGRRLMFGSSNRPVLDREIVGLVADSRSDVRKPARETVYYPYAQIDQPERLTFYVRTTANESQVAPAIRQLVRSADPGLPVRDLEPMTIRVRDSVYADRLIAFLSSGFGVLATLLAAIGLYGLIAYAVARRTPEIGVRMALGAAPGQVLRMVLLEAVSTAGAGIALGLLAAVALGRLVRAQLFGVAASDPVILAAAALLMAAIAVLAALVPARRAAAINPVSALKYE